jgi:hypothetical protein
MSTTVRELIERLQECDPDATVLMAHQEGWPLQFDVLGVAEASSLRSEPCAAHGDRGCDDCDTIAETEVVWIVQGEHPANPYAPRAAWTVAR